MSRPFVVLASGTVGEFEVLEEAIHPGSEEAYRSHDCRLPVELGVVSIA